MRHAAFLDEAREEMLAAADYYEEKMSGLGWEFIRQVHATVGFILAFPESGVAADARTRRSLVKRFPFGVLYRIEAERILIVAVMDLRRKPGYWRDRA
jgi:toxin ParE1/3/4